LAEKEKREKGIKKSTKAWRQNQVCRSLFYCIKKALTGCNGVMHKIMNAPEGQHCGCKCANELMC
jgi:hypothetical protein